MDLLSKYLDKIGVKTYGDLTHEEKDTYKGWEEALTGKKLTDEDVARFLLATEEELIDELTKTAITDKRDSIIKAQLELVRKIKVFLRSPELEKKMVEMQLLNLTK